MKQPCLIDSDAIEFGVRFPCCDPNWLKEHSLTVQTQIFEAICTSAGFAENPGVATIHHT